MKPLALTLILVLAAVSARGATYYVSPSGNDANAGTATSAPWQTLAKVSSVTFQAGDKILFQAGGTWSGGVVLHGSGISSSPITVDQYGTGNKPLLQGGGAVTSVVELSNCSYWDVNNLEITNAGAAGSAHNGIYGHYNSTTRLNSIHISNVDVHNVDCPNNAGCGCICFNEIIGDLQVNNCTAHDTGGQGIFFGDDYAWVVPKVQTTFDTYASTDVVVQNCTVYNCGDSGIEVWGVKRPLIQYCTAHDCNLGSSTVYVGIWIMDCENGVIQFNNSYHHKAGYDGECYDVDVLCFNTTVQYNYAHDNDYIGIIVYGYTQNGNPLSTSGVTIRYNIAQNCTAGSFALSGDVLTNTNWYNNTSYVASSGKQVTGVPYNGTVPGTHTFTNNIFYQGGFYYNTFAAGAVQFNNNCYFNTSVGLPQDAHAINANPQLVNPGSGGVTANTVDGYKLQSGSPCIDAGATISNNGGRDYWGTAVPTNNTADVGAYEFVSGASVLTTISVTPNNITVPANGQQQFTATGLDQFGNPVTPQPTFIWSASGGGTFSTGLLGDGGFEAGLGPWTTYNTPAVLSNTNVHSGTTAATLNANSGFFQQLSGLTPGATYILTGWARVQNSGDTVWLGVKNYGGAEISLPITSTTYTHGAVAFTMPAGNTTALVYLWMAAASGQAYGDDIDLETNGIFLRDASTAGPFTITASSGNLSGAATINPKLNESPYGGTPWPVPGKIEAENYDVGGEGIAYHDTTAGNTGGAYRGDDVDVRGCVDTGGGYQVGWTAAGEWLKYTVNVSASGNYVLTERIATGAAGGALHVECDGANLTGSVSVPNTGGWDTWQSLTQTVSLNAGQHLVRIYIETGGFDINYISFAVPAPVITTQPANQTVNAGQTATFSVTASGSGLKYQWSKNGAAISGATGPSYTTPATTTSDNGASFTVVVSNAGGNVASTAAILTVHAVNAPPVINSGATATPATVQTGETVSFSVGASDPNGDALTYTWSFGDGGSASGASVNHSYAVAGNFTATVTVTDPAGANVSSSTPVTVNALVVPAVHVGSLSMRLNSSRTGKSATATVTIVDNNGAAVSGATVAGAWSGLTTASVSGVTDANGQVQFTSAKTKRSGTFTFTLSTVSAAGYTYASGLNAANRGSVTTSGGITLAAPLAADSAPIDLGTVAVNQSFRMALPSAPSGARGSSAELPPGVRISGTNMGGKPSTAGTFTFEVQFKTKAGATMQTYVLTVAP